MEEREDPTDDERELPPGLEEVLRRNLEGELHREQAGPGTVIGGKWELRRLLGAGGFGKVWEAWHIELDQPVAIKILDARHGGAEVRQRFLEEARLMAGVGSEHLVRVSDYGELPDGSPYFVMELVAGQTLRHRVRERLSVSQAQEIAEELLEGLAEVHRRGIVHGDIKPENVIVGEDGKTRLVDFGLAHAAATAGEGVGGTPPYMAPEILFDGASTSARTDVYAVGVVLYELLTGRLPHGHADMGFEKIRRAWERKPMISSIRPHCAGVPEAPPETVEALDELVMVALARDPTARFKSAQKMLDELRKVRRLPLSAEALAPTLTPESGAVRSMVLDARTTAAIPTRSSNGWLTLRKAVMATAFVAIAAIVAWLLIPDPAVGPLTKKTQEAEPGLVAADLERARGGIVVAIPQGAGSTAETAYTAFCVALDGNRPRVEGTTPVYCVRVPASSTLEDVLALAESARVSVVVLAGDEGLAVRSTSHDRENPLLAKLDRLPLPTDPAVLEQVAPLLKAVVGASGAMEVEIPVITLDRVDPQWLVLGEWLRWQQGHRTHEDFVRREQLKNRLARMRDRGEVDGIGFYSDLAVLVWASSANCVAAAPALQELTARGEHEHAIRIAALLEQAECVVGGDDTESRVPAPRLAEAQALLEEAFDSSGDPSCVRVAAIGTISRIDRGNGGDALWQANVAQLPRHDACEPATWSRVLAVRGDALVGASRWCEAASAYALAFGAMRTKVEPLLAWAEYDTKCNPSRDARPQELLDELDRALASERFGRPEQRTSLAFARWWLTRDPDDVERVMAAYAQVKEGEPALIEGVGRDLEREICGAAAGVACSLGILARHKRAGSEEELRRSLGLR